MATKRGGAIGVVIADDHAVVRRGLAQIIEEEPGLCLVGEADNGHHLMELIEKESPGVVVMDIHMPQKSGWDVMLQLKGDHRRPPVIVLSISPEEDYAVKFMKAGAAGYLTKSSAPEQLVEAIFKVARGGKFITPALAEQLAMQMDRNPEKEPHEGLSPREFQIMCLLASGKTVSEIARDLSLSVPTISTHRARILDKMNMKTNAQLTSYAYKNNLVS